MQLTAKEKPASGVSGAMIKRRPVARELVAGRHWGKSRFRERPAQDDRFLSKDPIGFAAGDTNLYRYVFNDPVNLKDPTGLDIYFAIGGGSYAVGSSPGSTTGSAGSFGIGVGYDSQTGETFTFTTSGSSQPGSTVSGLYVGGGVTSGVFPGSQQQFLGSGTSNNVAAGFLGSAGVSGGTSGGRTGYSGDFFGIGFGATVNTQQTYTNFVGHVAGPNSCGP